MKNRVICKDLEEWREMTLKSCNNKCYKCGSKYRLHAHHIKPKAQYPELILDLANGIALCINCHSKVHPYMKKSYKVDVRTPQGIIRKVLNELQWKNYWGDDYIHFLAEWMNKQYD